MEGTMITGEGIMATYMGLFNYARGSDVFDSYGYYIPDRLPLFHVRFPRKTKKRLKKRNLLMRIRV